MFGDDFFVATGTAVNGEWAGGRKRHRLLAGLTNQATT